LAITLFDVQVNADCVTRVGGFSDRCCDVRVDAGSNVSDLTTTVFFFNNASSHKNQLPRYSRTLCNTSILFLSGDSALQSGYRNQRVNVVGKCVTVCCGGHSKPTHTLSVGKVCCS